MENNFFEQGTDILPQTINLVKEHLSVEPYNLIFKSMTSAPKTPDLVQIRDTFQTPKYAVDLLLPFIPKDIKLIWEPACGNGKISKRLVEHGFDIWSTDITFNYNCTDLTWNFTDSRNILENQKVTAECIITNPPYSIKELFIERAFEYNLPFAFLINADYSAKTIDWIQRGCEKIIPNRRIRFITPFIIDRVNEEEKTNYQTVEEIPPQLLYKYSSSQFHSMWLTYGFNIGRTETFVDLPIKEMKENV